MKVFDNVSDLALARLLEGQVVETKGAVTSTDGYGGSYLIKTSGAGITLGNGNIAAPQHTNLAVSPLSWGAVADGATDDTAIMQQCLDSSNLVVIDGISIAVTSITIPENCKVDCINGGGFISVGATDSRTVTVNARTTGTLFVDGNNRAVNTIFFPEGLGYTQYYDTLIYQNIRMVNEASPIITGVTMFADEVRGGWCFGKSLDQNGYSNRSFPQSLVTGGGLYHLEGHYLKDGSAGFVPTGLKAGQDIFTATGEAYLQFNQTVDCIDNSAYLLGGYVWIGQNVCNTEEEGVQVNAVTGADIGRITAVGRSLGAFNVQNTLGPVNIGEVVGAPTPGIDFDDYAENVPTQICYTRPGNLTIGSKDITVGNVKGYFMRGLTMSEGEVESFSVENVDIVLCYKPSANPVNQWENTGNPSSTSWWNFAACKRVNRKNIKVQIRNFEVTPFPTFTSGNNFATTSRPDVDFGNIENEEFYLIENDGTEATNNHVRVEAPQDNQHQEGQYYRNIGSTTFAVNPQYGDYQKDSINGKPQTGYWYAGQVLWERSNAQDGVMYHKCITSGSPGTWITVGGIITGSGTPVGSVTPDYVGQVYRDTGPSDLYMAYGTSNTFWKLIG